MSGGATQAETMSAESDAHDANAEVCARLLLVAAVAEPRLDEARHFDREQAEHRRRENHEKQAEERDDPGLVESGLQIEALADGAGGDARGRIGERHAEHISAATA